MDILQANGWIYGEQLHRPALQFINGGHPPAFSNRCNKYFPSNEQQKNGFNCSATFSPSTPHTSHLFGDQLSRKKETHPWSFIRQETFFSWMAGPQDRGRRRQHSNLEYTATGQSRLNPYFPSRLSCRYYRYIGNGD